MKIFFSLFLFLQLNCLLAQDSDRYNFITNEVDQIILDKQFVFSEKEVKADLDYLINQEDVFDLELGHYVNNGVFKKNHWLKINLVNLSKTSEFVFEFSNHYVDSLSIYLFRNQTIFKEFPQKGLYFPENNLSSFLTNKYGYEYPLTIQPNDSVALYINAIVNDGPFRVINKLYTKNGKAERKKEVRINTTYLLLLFGFAGLVIIFSLAMFISTRRRIYFYYFGFVSSIILNIICLHHFISPLLVEKYLLFGNNYTEMFSYLQVTFMLLYTNHFLSLKVNHNRIYKLFKGLAILNIFIFFLGLYFRVYPSYYEFSFYFSKVILAVITILVPSVGLYLAIKRSLMGLYFIVAYTPLVCFAIYIILQSLNVVSFANPINWELITFFEILVLSMAMVHQYFLLIKESSNYQKIIIEQREKSIEDIIETQDRERTRIARDIHDGVLQRLGVLVLKSKNFVSNSDKNTDNETSDFVENLEESAKELREISHQIMPKALETDATIIDAINNLLLDSMPVAGIKYEFEYFNIPDKISEKIKITIYRVLQELLSNIIKHSQSTKINVQLFIIENKITLVVDDNGIGISESSKNNGIGLSNILSRVEALNGNVNMENNLKNGTSTTVNIPLLVHEYN